MQVITSVWNRCNDQVDDLAGKCFPQSWQEERKTPAKVAILSLVASGLLQVTTFNSSLPISVRVPATLLSLLVIGKPLYSRIHSHVNRCDITFNGVEKVMMVATLAISVSVLAGILYMTKTYKIPSAYLWSLEGDVLIALLTSYVFLHTHQDPEERGRSLVKNLRKIESDIKDLDEGFKKLKNFVDSRPQLKALFQKKLKEHKSYIIELPKAPARKDRDDIHQETVNAQIRRLAKITALRELEVLLRTYPDLWDLFQQEVEQAKGEGTDFSTFTSSEAFYLTYQSQTNDPDTEEKKLLREER